MDLSVYRDTYLRLNFDEANIVWENKDLSRSAMFVRLQELQQNTKDPMLKASVASLLWKLKQTDENVYNHMTAAAKTGDLLFPGNYVLSQKS